MEEAPPPPLESKTRVKAAAGLAGVSAALCLTTIMNAPIWPVIGVAAAVVVVCSIILKKS